MHAVLLICLLALGACLGSGGQGSGDGGIVAIAPDTGAPGIEFGAPCLSDSDCPGANSLCAVGQQCATVTCGGAGCEVACRGGSCEPVGDMVKLPPECVELEDCCASLGSTASNCYESFADPNLIQPGNCVGLTEIFCPAMEVTPCDDGVWDGDETDIDCGGPTCPQCPDASRCLANRDCINGTCTDGYTCDASAIVTDCPAGTSEVGRFAEWCGKVNIYRSINSSEWASDPTCGSGCGQDPMTYCQKYWPQTAVTAMLVPMGDKVFETAQCATAYTYVGEVEIACCAIL